MAQAILRHLNMAPTVHARASLKVWFNKPWELEKTDEGFMKFKEGAAPVRGEDGDSEVIRETMSVRQSRIEGVEVVNEDTLEPDFFNDG